MGQQSDAEKQFNKAKWEAEYLAVIKHLNKVLEDPGKYKITKKWARRILDVLARTS